MSTFYLSHKVRKTLRNYANALFHSNKWPVHKRRYVFYLALLPALEWVRVGLLDAGLEHDEVESELFLLTAILFKEYDSNKSSIVPYVEKYLPWKVEKLLVKLKEKPPLAAEFLYPKQYYEIEGEFYLSSPSFLLEERWLAKDLSQAQKNIILKVLSTDAASARALANECRLGRSVVENQLQNIAGIMKGKL